MQFTVDSIRKASSLVPGAREKREAPCTHCLRMRLISPGCGDSGLFLDSSVSCDVRVWTRYSKLVRIIQWRVIKVRIFSKQFLMPFTDFRPQLWFSKLSTLRLHFGQMRFSKPSSSFNVKSDKVLIADASFSWLPFFTKQCYSIVAISHRGSTKAVNQCYFR